MKWFTPLVFCLILAGCSSVGKKCDFEMMKQSLKLNVSTNKDVLKMCGEPLSKDSNMNEGTEVWHYLYITKNITPLGVLTHATGIGDEIESKRTIMDITLKNNVVIDAATEESSLKKLHFK